MGLYTYQEYKEKGAENNIKISAPIIQSKPLITSKIEYILLHPDLITTTDLKYKVLYQGEMIELEIKKGKTVTDNEIVKNILLKQGFYYITEKEVKKCQ